MVRNKVEIWLGGSAPQKDWMCAMKRVIGITGGVGSGKSVVLGILKKDYRAQVIEADIVAKELMMPGKPGYEGIRKEWGEKYFAPDGTIDKDKLGTALYDCPDFRLRLNAIIHPLVRDEVAARIKRSRRSIIAYEAALPEAARMDELCDEIWYIHVPERDRIRRLMEGRGYTENKCRSILAAQPPEYVYINMAAHVIDNRGSLEETAAQIKVAMDPEGDHPRVGKVLLMRDMRKAD